MLRNRVVPTLLSPRSVRARAVGAEDRRSPRLGERLPTAAPLVGNAAFLIGSVCFLSEATQTAGVWAFVIGSALLLGEQLRKGG